MASGDNSATTNTIQDFLRSFSVIDVDSEESDYDELTPIPETPADPSEDITATDSSELLPPSLFFYFVNFLYTFSVARKLKLIVFLYFYSDLSV